MHFQYCNPARAMLQYFLMFYIEEGWPVRYRTLGKTGLSVSEIGLGCEHLQWKDEKLIREVIDAALDGGVNILDIFMVTVTGVRHAKLPVCIRLIQYRAYHLL